MILLGCLLAFGAAVAPRVVLILAWIFSTRWAVVWQDDFLLPLLGIIFLPYTTIMFMLSVTILPGGGTSLEGFAWLWIILGLFLDFMKWSQMIANRKEAQTQTAKYYPSGAPRTDAAATAAADTAAADAPATAEPTSPPAAASDAAKDDAAASSDPPADADKSGGSS